jgi:predicted phage terminase large subunit-like protein
MNEYARLTYEDYEPTPRQLEFHRLPRKFKLYGGAMGGGKSVALCAEVIRLAAAFPGNQIYLARKTLRDLKKTTLVTLFEMLPQRVVESHNKTDGVLTFHNGSQIILGDLEQTDKLKSLNLGAYAIDEASEASDELFLMLNSRLRLKVPGIRYFGLLASNPEPGWLKDRFVEPQLSAEPLSDHVFIQALPKDNPHLPEGYLESLYNEFPPLWRTKYLEGSWDVFDSQIFKPEWNIPSDGIPEVVAKFTAVDPAISEKDEADETVIITLGIDRDNVIHEIETVAGRWSFDQILNNCIAVYHRHKPDCFGVEYVAFQKALGDALINRGITVTELKADMDKVRRAIAVTDLLEQGRVRINNQTLQKQMLEFPKGTHDDYVDALVYALKLIKMYSSESYKEKIDKYAGLDGRSKQFWKCHYEELEGDTGIGKYLEQMING